MSTAPVATPRADARRNRAKVLTAAEELFATVGLSVPLDEIARAAGVGAGTVYRHFPTKYALFEAVMEQRIDLLGQHATAALGGAEPAADFYGFLDHAMEQARLNRALCDAMARHDEWRAAVADGPHCRFTEAFARLLRRAQDVGAVRRDLDVHDVAALIPGYVAMVGHREDLAGEQRLKRLLWDGLRPPERNSEEFRNETMDTSAIRYETVAIDSTRDETGEAATAPRCATCGSPIAAAATGRRPKYCSPACRQKAHRRRAGARSGSGG